MNENPLVSVIIIFLNAEKFIEESIQSVLVQTYSNWELILVDDGSTDESTNIALTYVDDHPNKVRYLEHENHKNKGISVSRNLGIKNAKGKYIATLDADDVWVAEKLEQQVSIMGSYPHVGMVFGNTLYWYSWIDGPVHKWEDHYAHDLMKVNTLKLNTVVKPPIFLVLALSSALSTPSMSNTMFRKSIAEQVGGFEDNFTGMHEDQAFLAKIFINTPVYVAEQCWDIYRQHEDSCQAVAELKGRFLEAEIFYLDWLKQYLSQNGYNDPDVIRALRQRTLKYKHPNLYKLSINANRQKRRLLKIINRIIGGLIDLSS